MKRQTKGRKMMIIICILISIIAVVVGRILFLITATKGKPIADYSNDQTALIVSQKKFDQYLNDNMINTLYIVGADATACVYKTSLGGVNRGYHVTILEDCVFSANKNVLNKMLLKYEKNEIGIKRINDFL